MQDDESGERPDQQQWNCVPWNKDSPMKNTKNALLSWEEPQGRAINLSIHWHESRPSHYM